MILKLSYALQFIFCCFFIFSLSWLLMYCLVSVSPHFALYNWWDSQFRDEETREKMAHSWSWDMKLIVPADSLEYWRAENYPWGTVEGPLQVCSRGLVSVYMSENHPRPGKGLLQRIRGSSTYAHMGLEIVPIPTIETGPHNSWGITHNTQKGLA